MSVDGVALVNGSCRVRVRSAVIPPAGRQAPVVAEGVVVAYSSQPQILVRADDGSQSWWPVTLPIEVQPAPPAAGVPAAPPAERRAIAVLAPLGHSVSAHRLLGFCAGCAGITMEQEVVGWRVWAVTNLPAARQT